jgi:hypothetical protein
LAGPFFFYALGFRRRVFQITGLQPDAKKKWPEMNVNERK